MKNTLFALSLTILFACGNTDSSEECDKRALQLGDKAVPILLTYPDKALEYLDEATAIDPMCFHSHYHRQIACMSLKKFDEALASSDVILKIKENYPAFVIQRGRIYELMGDSIQAQEAYSKGISAYEKIVAENDSWNKKLEFGESLILAGQEEKGTKLLQKIKDENPDNELLQGYIIHTREELQQGPQEM